jgi:para-aminobenzoate synthetase component 1
MMQADVSLSAPLVRELSPPPHTEDVFLRLCGKPHCLFLDSAMRHPTLGRYSFVAADPFDYLELPADAGDGLGPWAARWTPFQSPTLPNLPPFQGGAAGLLGYELGRSLEKLPATRFDEFGMPTLALGLYDVVIAFDHQTGRAWIVSQGWPEVDPLRRRQRAAARLEEFAQLVASPAPRIDAPFPKPARPALSADQLAPQYPLEGVPGLTSNFSRAEYLRTVRRVIDYIVAGDVFQVNLAQRLLCPARDRSPTLYLRLRQQNPAPFAGYFDLDEFQVVSASPERFLQVREGHVETRPIKGTRRRGEPHDDRLLAEELRGSEKDRAENVMIVDLLRNDLSRVCRPESVRVSRLCDVETYPHLLHLVSTVRGQLRGDCGPLDLVRAAFPGGSVTGAPKVRAMEIIAELEPTARGAYCGSLGYLGFDGTMDLSILIRTVTAGRGWWQAAVGGGIIAPSIPEQEYQETLDKAEGLLHAMKDEG